MKRVLTYVFSILLIHTYNVNAQCPGCAVDPVCSGLLSDIGICNPILSDATVAQFYDADVSLYLPFNTVDTVAGIELEVQQYLIKNVTGLPSGLNWECGSPDCTYNPMGPGPNADLGCIKICGTPDDAVGLYTFTILTDYDVFIPEFGIFITVFDQTFQGQINVLPPIPGTDSYDVSGVPNCGSYTVTFTANYDGSPQYTSWEWDFGNGSNSSDKNPAPVNYEAPGTYEVSLATTISDLRINSVTVNGLNENLYCNDLQLWEEIQIPLLGCAGFPELIVQITDNGGNVVYLSDVVNEANGPTTFFINGGSGIPINNPPYTVAFLERDYILPDVLFIDTEIGSFLFNPTGPGNVNVSDAGGNSGSIAITSVPIQEFFDSSTIIASGSPALVSGMQEESTPSGASVSLSWSPLPNAQFYQAKGRKVGNVVFATFVTANTNKTVGNLDPGSSYEWKMRALCSNGWVTPFTDLQTFTTNPAPTYEVKQELPSGELNALDVFPNPSNGTFTVSLYAAELEIVSVGIFDVLGRKLYEETIEVVGYNEFSMDLSRESSGVYFVQIHQKEGVLNTSIIIE